MRQLKILYTSDTHGHIFPWNYGTGEKQAEGLLSLEKIFEKDGNTLIIDGGDTTQGSPFTMFTHKLETAKHPIATVMNKGKYDYVTLGNHDFNYGEEHLRKYLNDLKATCLCGNVVDTAGTLPVKTWEVRVMENGLRVGIVGVVTDYITVWERPENIQNLQFLSPFDVARQALTEMEEEKVDLKICLYHGGFEADLRTGEVLSTTHENIGYKIATELDFDLLLTGHQHMAIEEAIVKDTHIVQPTSNAEHYLEVTVDFSEKEKKISSMFKTGTTDFDDTDLDEVLTLEKEVQTWLDTPVGHLSEPLLPDTKAMMALCGSPIADFFNQIQLEVTGADISCTSLGNDIKGFDEDVTVRDVVSTYIFPNTLCVIEVTGLILKQALERTASYLRWSNCGTVEVSKSFVYPKVEHFNYDYFANVTFDVDLRKTIGSRVSNIKVRGKDVQPADTFSLVMNNYRTTGAGGYECYIGCPLLKEGTTELAELIINYLEEKKFVDLQKFEPPNYKA